MTLSNDGDKHPLCEQLHTANYQLRYLANKKSPLPYGVGD